MAFTLLFLSDSVQSTCASIAGVIFQSWVSPEVEPWCVRKSHWPASQEPAGVALGVVLCCPWCGYWVDEHVAEIQKQTFVYFTNRTQL